jgi:hypothetical protein
VQHPAVVTQKHHADSVLRYLQRHSRHIDSLELDGESGYGTQVLSSLPKKLRLRSLQLANLQLQEGSGLQGVLDLLVGQQPSSSCASGTVS